MTKRTPQVSFSLKYDLNDLPVEEEIAVREKLGIPVCDDIILAVDWDLWSGRKWDRSWSPASRMHWHPIRGLDEIARRAILERFGLWNWEREFPSHKIIFMSPAQLIAERKKKEALYNLPRLEVATDNFYWEAGKTKEEMRFCAEEYD